VANIFLIQLIGVMLTVAGMIALTASAHIFGTPMSPAERRRASDEWNRRRNVYRLPINLEAIVSTVFFLGGIGILTWSKFEYCTFLAFWLPSLPEAARVLLSCK
jgi:hypothetical protein